MFVIGIVCNGAGVSQDFETKAKMYTIYNSKYGQTYSLVVPPSRSSSMSYLKDHVYGLEKDPVMAKNCKIFFVNMLGEESSESPFNLSIGGFETNMSLVYTTSNIKPSSYFNLSLIYGRLTLDNVNEIILPKEIAVSISSNLGFDSIEKLVDSNVNDTKTGQTYSIVGIFEEKNAFLSKFVSTNYLIGSFQTFSSNNTNPCLAFSTSKNYLENLFFLYRLAVYIDPPNYNRTTFVSTEGNDFFDGGNEYLTSKIYNSTTKSENIIFQFIYYFSFAGLNVILIGLFIAKKINKKGIVVLSISLFAQLCFFSLLGYLIDFNVLKTSMVTLNMISGTSIVVVSLISLLVCFVLCSVKTQERNKKFENLEYYEIKL